MSKLILLGIDGLDHDLVEQLNLVALMQKQHGKITVPISPITGSPFSPSVWATFLTGRNVEASFIAIDESLNRFGELDHETFIDWVGVGAVNVPFYNHEIETLATIIKIHKLRKTYRDNQDKRETIISNMIKAHTIRAKEILIETIQANDDPDCSVVFAFIQTMDTLQHYLFERPEILKNIYLELDVIVSNFKKQIRDTPLIIVSDHGFKGYHHSHEGFFSSNHTLTNKPTNIIDFHKIIETIMFHERD